MLKIRTMAPGEERRHEELVRNKVERGDSFLLSQENLRRSSALGRILRRSSLDELPQLANVFLGHMSVVGPRPILPSEIEFVPPYCHARFAVLPGITGLAQIRGRSDLGTRAYFASDIEMVEGYSLRLYLKIVLKTPYAVIRGVGAS